METLQALLEEKLRAAVESPGAQLPQVTPASDRRFGDYQTNIAMLIAKERRANPREIAGQILERLDVSEISDTPSIAGAGFINFKIRPDFLAGLFPALQADARLGVAKAVKPKRIVIDFSSPNIAKPMHIGHIRSTVLGDALCRIARFLGHEVVADNHLGDWGAQFGKIIYGWKHHRDDAALAKDPVMEMVRLYKEINARCETEPELLQASREELVKLQQGDEENLAIWRKCIELSRHEFEEVYALLDVRFDEWLGESFYHDRLAPLVDRLLKSGIAEISQGAACIFFPDDPALAGKPCLIRKSDGGFLYATTDIATIEYRVERWNPDAIWYVTGAPQQLHLAEVFAAARKMKIGADLRHISFGNVLGQDRKLMKTRSGENVPLREVLTEAQERARRIIEEKNPDLSAEQRSGIARVVGIGAVKYAELSQYRMTDYIFAWEKMLSLTGNTAPYLQNAYVRIQSIFRKADMAASGSETIAFSSPAETELALKLFQFGETVPQVLDDFRPNLFANYLYELATIFHRFYETCPVLKAEPGQRTTRLALCSLTAKVLKQGLELLGIEMPERM